tara:strand:+ start:686 stop:1090 length:405 start_codon:yes stop_codon:yes gene_type:complete
MTWSYSDSLGTDRDLLRFKIGDVDTDEQLLSNELLDALLTSRGSPTLAAIDAVEGILAKFARDIDRSALGMGGARSQKTQFYRDLLKELRAEAARGDTSIFFGGGSISQKDSNREDSDAPLTPFRIDQFKNNGA